MEQLVFAHISDPHFAHERFSDQTGSIPGQRGHDLLLCQALPGALAHLRRRTGTPTNARIPLVMSGDLTRTGRSPHEFHVGKEYLESQWPNPQNLPTRRYGLNLGKDYVVMIPGNHDHWDGDTRNMWGYNAAIKPTHFADTPFRAVLRNSRGQLELEFFGVDSCSGFPPIGAGPNRRARGRIDARELNRLTCALARSASRETEDRKNGVRRVRVVLCHHSFSGHWLVSGFFGSLELDGPSRRVLMYLAKRYGVVAILTGHMHDPLADRYVIPGAIGSLREFRSATTLQGPARYFKQGFYGHRVLLDDHDRVFWSVFPYEWQGSYFYPLAVGERAPRPGQWNPFYFRAL